MLGMLCKLNPRDQSEKHYDTVSEVYSFLNVVLHWENYTKRLKYESHKYAKCWAIFWPKLVLYLQI
jgi:hypothetical protein